MAFGYDVRRHVVAYMDHDPAADDVLPVFRATKDCEMLSAYAIVTNAVGASTDNYFALNLLNGGAAGTATTAISGTIGGTAGWTALRPVSFVVSEGTLTAGDVVVVNYNETGTGTFASMVVQLEIVEGIGA